MDILNFLQKNKILPSKSLVVESEAKKLARRIASNNYYLMDLDNEELTNFANAFNSEILDILTDRYLELQNEVGKAEKSINNLKCNN